jgi:hypothetical protein
VESLLASALTAGCRTPSEARFAKDDVSERSTLVVATLYRP